MESGVKYVKENALAGRAFPSLAALNQFLAHWEKAVADLRIPGTTQRQVAELFGLKRPSLSALLASLFPLLSGRPQDSPSRRTWGGGKGLLPLPPEYLRQRVWVRFDSREVRIFVQDKNRILKQIQVHRRLEAGQFTNAREIGGGLGSLQANLQYWLGSGGNLGASCDLWARAVAANRGIGAIRTLM